MKEILNYYENEKKAFEGYEVPEKLRVNHFWCGVNT